MILLSKHAEKMSTRTFKVMFRPEYDAIVRALRELSGAVKEQLAFPTQESWAELADLAEDAETALRDIGEYLP